MATSGLILFSKEFVNSIAKPRLVGSLITAIIEFAQQTTGMGVTYIELSNVSITIITNEAAKIFCALFYDREDGVVFGRLLCNEILKAFTQEYSSDFSQVGRNLKDFYGFHKKFTYIVKHSAIPVLSNFESHHGVVKAILFIDQDIIETPKSSVEQLGALANLTMLVELGGIMMNNANDSFQQMTMECNESRQTLLWKMFEKCYLIAVVDKAVGNEAYKEAMEETLELIEQVCVLHANLLQISR